MSTNTDDRHALEQIADEPDNEQIAYFRKPFMVVWAAVQESSSELVEDYGLSPELAQLWVAERLRQVADSLVDRLAERAVAHGMSKSNVSRATCASPTNALRRFPRLRDLDEGRIPGRMLIDDVLDSLD
ncbi:transcriptional regulator [Bifidobacterium criceti]|uniref:Transcriptional regulator n=1 Tax=Bifidobacterium criceti TaxID=1960969 RepID=A0A2A2EEI1_9BIFI|nr:transcriptional regulator [Bifidobacterium criceti]PAU67308.1 transcriptional regulator [Bifidobacterium criceti]